MRQVNAFADFARTAFRREVPGSAHAASRQRIAARKVERGDIERLLVDELSGMPPFAA